MLAEDLRLQGKRCQAGAKAPATCSYERIEGVMKIRIIKYGIYAVAVVLLLQTSNAEILRPLCAFFMGYTIADMISKLFDELD